MGICVEKITEETLAESTAFWNEVVREGKAFTQQEELTVEEARRFFAAQSYTGVARTEEGVAGMYILHPNNVGRCGHICNASYAVRGDQRGRHIGPALVRDCMARAKELGFRVLQFNAVVASNTAALRLYASLGFTKLGAIPGGFRNREGVYEDIIPHYIEL